MFVGVKVFFFSFILDDPWIFRKKKYIRLRNCNLVVQNCTADAARIGHLAVSPAAWAITIASALWLRPSQASQGIRVLERRFTTPCVYIHVFLYVYTHTHIVFIYIYKCRSTIRNVNIHAYIYNNYMHIPIYIYIYIHSTICVYTYICIYIISIFFSTCAYIYI